MRAQILRFAQNDNQKWCVGNAPYGGERVYKEGDRGVGYRKDLTKTKDLITLHRRVISPTGELQDPVKALIN